MRHALPVVLALTFLTALVAVPVWPGVFSIDSQAMYESGRTGAVSNQYAPVLESIWGLFTDVGIGPWIGLLFGVGLVVGGLYSVFTLQLRPWPAVAATWFTVLWPASYGFLGWVGRDVWFAGLLFLALGVVGRLAVRRTWPLAAAAVVIGWFAADARQNGLPLLVIVTGVAVYLMLSADASRRRAALVAGVAALVIAPATLALAHRAVVDVHSHPEQPLLYQDLLAVSLRLNESQLSRSVFPSQDIGQIRRTWKPGNVGLTIYPPDSPVVFDFTPTGDRVNDVVRDDWAEMVQDHPITYVGQRLRLALRQLGVGMPPQFPYFLETDTSGVAAARFEQEWPSANEARQDYLEALGGGVPTGGALFRVWPYLLLGLGGALALAIWTPKLRLFAMTALIVQVSLQALLAFAAIAVEFRFQAFQVLLGIVMTVLALAAWRDRRALPAVADRSTGSAPS